MRELVLIAAPSNLGLKRPMAFVEPGVKFFAAAMEKEKLAEKTGIKKRIWVEAPKYDGFTDTETGVKNADKIIILDEGKIIEQGTHNQLINQNGYYAALYLKQLSEKELQ